MRFDKLDLNLLVALEATLTERSIVRAAERLHLSPAATSNALARLRDYFGDELLVQVGRKMELTPRAEVLREAVRDVLMRVRTTLAAQPEFDPKVSDREFRIFVSDYTTVTLVPHLLAVAQAQSQTLRFRLLPQVPQPHRSLERGEVDLMIIPRAFVSPDHPAEPLWEEDFRCVVWNSSRHAKRGLSLEEYVAAQHVVVEPPGGRGFEASVMDRQGIERRVGVSTFSFSAAPQLVVGTALVATVHGRLARMAEQTLPITLLPLPVAMPKMEQIAQWHKYLTHDPGIVWLRGALRNAVELMDGQLHAEGRE